MCERSKFNGQWSVVNGQLKKNIRSSFVLKKSERSKFNGQ